MHKKSNKTNNKSISKISAPTKPKTITKDEDKAENEYENIKCCHIIFNDNNEMKINIFSNE